MGDPQFSNDKDAKMNANKGDPVWPGHKGHVCNICGKSSESTICDGCSERIRIEALARKRREETGDAWTHWV
jgi:hypothetical protein